MKIRKLDLALLAVLSLALILLGAFSGLSQQESEMWAGGALSMANPAAVNCEQNGGTYEDGECVFPSGSSCDAWSYLRGECSPQPEPGPTPVPGGDWTENLKSNCESNGGTVDGSNCVFSDGSSCDLEAFFLGECQPKPPQPVGVPGTEHFTFQAVGAGETDLVMKYLRPDGSVAKTKRWHIVVTG